MIPDYHPKALAASGAHHRAVEPTATRQYLGAPLPNSYDAISKKEYGQRTDPQTPSVEPRQPDVNPQYGQFLGTR